MSEKAFNKNLSHRCEYCVYGERLSENKTLCRKHGVTDSKDACRKYKYDPLKRVPETAKLPTDYTPEDFSL